MVNFVTSEIGWFLWIKKKDRRRKKKGERPLFPKMPFVNAIHTCVHTEEHLKKKTYVHEKMCGTNCYALKMREREKEKEIAC